VDFYVIEINKFVFNYMKLRIRHLNKSSNLAIKAHNVFKFPHKR
jgi:hypothetical protein